MDKAKKAHAVQLLLSGLSYRAVSAQAGYSLPTITKWANEPIVKKKLERMWKLKKKAGLNANKDNLPAFMELLRKRHSEIYLSLLDAYQDFTKSDERSTMLADNPEIIMHLLERGHSYRSISDQTGSSTRTIGKVAKKMGHKLNRKQIAVNARAYSLSIFMVWLKKNHAYLHALAEPICKQYNNPIK